MKRSKTPQVFLILAGVALAGGAGGTFLQYQEIGEKVEQLKTLEKDARDPKEIAAELDDTSTQLAKSQTELEHLEKGVPAFAYVPTMLKELEQFGKTCEIEVLGVRPIPKADSKDKNKKKKKEAYEEIAIEVKGRGTFKAVQRFITKLTEFPKIVGVRALSMTPKDQPDQVGLKNLDVTIELRAYLFAPTEGDIQSAQARGQGNQTATPLDSSKEKGNAPAASGKSASNLPTGRQGS